MLLLLLLRILLLRNSRRLGRLPSLDCIIHHNS